MTALSLINTLSHFVREMFKRSKLAKSKAEDKIGDAWFSQPGIALFSESFPSISSLGHMLQFTRAIRKIALSALLCCFAAIFAHEMALPSYIYTGSFSCKHGICLHECTCEL